MKTAQISLPAGTRMTCHRFVPPPFRQHQYHQAQTTRLATHLVPCASKGFGAPASTFKKHSLSKQASCPCGTGLAYNECCRPYHKDDAAPPTAEELMRSRYSAYSKGLVQYIVDTTHPENPLAKGEGTGDSEGSTLMEDVRATCEKIKWDKLKILETRDGATPDEAFVSFQTYFKVKGQKGQRAQGFHTQTFVEHSRFLREEGSGRWLYVDGEQEWSES